MSAVARTVVREAELELASRRLRFTLVRMARRRHVHLVVGEDGELQVRAPWRFSLAEAEALIRGNAAWVQGRVSRARERALSRPSLAPGTWLPLGDGRVRLELCEGRPGTAVREGEVLRVAAGDDPQALRLGVQAWYRREANRVLPPRLYALGAPHALKPARVAIRAQRTRWGSCSARGTISLNWRLVQLPEALGDYVLVHELCHLRHLDHSPAFWALVEGLMPDWRARRERLRGLVDTAPL